MKKFTDEHEGEVKSMAAKYAGKSLIIEGEDSPDRAEALRRKALRDSIETNKQWDLS